jgi:hypothetical protein
MNMKKKANELCHLPISKLEKIKCLNEFILDCKLELEAQAENMHPEVKHDLAEGLRLATDCIRKLEA